jgi:hypothetical protein
LAEEEDDDEDGVALLLLSFLPLLLYLLCLGLDCCRGAMLPLGLLAAPLCLEGMLPEGTTGVGAMPGKWVVMLPSTRPREAITSVTLGFSRAEPKL